jgi:rhamnosyltransferase
VSIIIRAKNEARDIGATLLAIHGQSMSPKEIIVIDSGSSDDTVGIARRHGAAILELPPEEWGYSHAINRAAAAATGDLLVILSAHCAPVDDRWLTNLTRHFADPEVAGVWGPGLRPGRPRPDPTPPERQLPGTYAYENRMWGLSNPNAAVRADLWREMPFDEALPAAEDKAWGKSAMERGFVIVHEPAATVWHQAHPPISAYRRSRAVEAGFALIFPEAGSRGPVHHLGRAAWRRLRFHLQLRHPVAFWNDVRRVPSTLAAVLGTVVEARRSRRPR